ncbi:UDP-2,4-diacetamido-2,4,6-trideoxy-beta-L-altropyranose hydrolase [Akkermansiaceae bacterium]|nr:UDP-2,4-diacetamido-2,4,6-trideoxy-beta-L-altropyranose hydrolase [Akkermansiaceae bacterium]
MDGMVGLNTSARRKILIRADAGGFTGTGHVMRMMALAQACLRRGIKVVIASIRCPQNLGDQLHASGIEHVHIEVSEPGNEEDSDATISLAREMGADWLVVDGYHFGYDYQKRIKKADLALLCVDDHGYSDRWCCDAILNQNLDAERSIKYQNDFVKPKILAGASFCLLREEFLKDRPSRAKWGRIERLLVTLGGSDPENATKAALELLNQACARSLRIRILAGADNQNVETLRSSESHHQVEVVQNASNMPEQYAWADGIISAGGSTCWEWLYLGLPGAIVTIADNQCPIVRALTEERRAALSLGLFNGSSFGANTKQLSKWIDTPAALCEAPVATGIIDGFGANRVAGFLSGSKVILREAKSEDSDQYFVWVNNPEVRKNSFSHDPISKDAHARWFSNRINTSYSCLLVVVDFEGNDLGQVRFDFDEQKQGWIVDFSIDSSFRGGGYGKAALLEALLWIRQKHEGRLLILADVLEINPVSKRLFSRLGFKRISSGDCYSSYSRTL